MAVQDGPTSIRVTWTPPSPLGDTTGYRIFYTGEEGGSSENEDVDGGNTSSHTLMGLTNGETYTLPIVVTASPGIPSNPVEAGTINISKINYTSFYLCHTHTHTTPHNTIQRHTFPIGELTSEPM